MIVITGASDGLGLQIAKAYSSVGQRVVNISRGDSPYADDNLRTDLTDEAAIEKVAQAIATISEPIEALINCAGVMSIEPLGKITASEIDRTFGVNVRAAILLVSGLVERLKKDGADIVNVASTLGLKANPDQAAYGASKWAMRGFSKNLQLELKDTNRVISFCIGGFKSDMSKKVHGEKLPEPESWMNPKDIADFMLKIIQLPKNMEVSEIIIVRRSAKQL